VKNHAVMALVVRYSQGKQPNSPDEMSSPLSARNQNSPPAGCTTTGNTDAHQANCLPAPSNCHEMPRGESANPQIHARPLAASISNSGRPLGYGRLSEDIMRGTIEEDELDAVLEQWLDENPSSSAVFLSSFLGNHSQALPSESLEIGSAGSDESGLLLLSDSESSEPTTLDSTTEDDDESEASDDVSVEGFDDFDDLAEGLFLGDSGSDGLDIDLDGFLDDEFEE